MAISFELTIRDPVHGHMRFTSLEKRIIDLPIFQRLRGLKQSSLANYTYPTALTSRFEHSLGAVQMGHKIVQHLFSDFPTESQELLKGLRNLYLVPPAMGDGDFADCVVQAVRLSCMLHDLGHLPFSHCFEADLTRALTQKGPAELWGVNEASEFRDQADRAQEFGLSGLKLHEFLGFAIARTHPSIATAPQGQLEELAYQITLDVLNPVHSDRGRDPALLKVLGRIVHGEVDADRMDFILRDSSMAGTGWGRFDPDRLIQCLALQRDGEVLELIPSARGISELEAFFVSRLAVYRWQYHHHNVVYYDLLLRLVVRELILGDGIISEHCSSSLMEELAFGNFICPSTEAGTKAGWIMRDDGLVWGILGDLYRNVHAASAKDPSATRLKWATIVLEELLFRTKHHITLWKDHLGYREFAGLVADELIDQVHHRSGRSPGECRERVEAWSKKDQPGLAGIAECATGALIKRIELDGFFDVFQEAMMADDNGNILIDYRRMSAFRRLPVSKLSELRVCGRDDGGSRTAALGDVSDILRGMGEPGAMEFRLFAYQLILVGPCPSKEQKQLACAEARTTLAKNVVRWALDTPGVLRDVDRNELEVGRAPESPAVTATDVLEAPASDGNGA